MECHRLFLGLISMELKLPTRGFMIILVTRMPSIMVIVLMTMIGKLIWTPINTPTQKITLNQKEKATNIPFIKIHKNIITIVKIALFMTVSDPNKNHLKKSSPWYIQLMNPNRETLSSLTLQAFVEININLDSF